MNKHEARRILDLDHYGSVHSSYGDIDGQYPYYEAEFNIKVRFNRWNSNLTDEQHTYVSKVEFDVYEFELEHLIDTIKEDKFPPIDCWQEGRSGGWLVCRFAAPQNGHEAIRLARAVQRISKLVENAVDYVSSDEYWLDYIEANTPEKGIPDSPFGNDPGFVVLKQGQLVTIEDTGYIIMKNDAGGFDLQPFDAYPENIA